MQKNYEHFNDPEIIRRVVNGEVDLFEVLIRKYNSFLYKIGRSYRLSHADTQDLMQDAYVSAYSNLKKFENRSSFKTWLTKIMLNHCYRKKHQLSFINEKAANDLVTEKSGIMFHNSSPNDHSSLTHELGHILENAIQNIPEDYRMVFTLRELNGLNVTETAEVLQISDSNVKVRLNRAKAMLRNEVQKSYSASDIFDFNLVYCDAMVKNVMDKIHRMIDKGT